MINKFCRNLIKNQRLLYWSFNKFSSKQQLINVPAQKYSNHRQELKQNIWRDVDVTGKRSQKTHLSNGEQLIKGIPVIRVHHDVVRCLGGVEPGTGHPQVYIQVNTRTPGEPVSCKWCGLRYALDLHNNEHEHHDHHN